jgi:dimethylhistidine N-methyltransferase
MTETLVKTRDEFSRAVVTGLSQAQKTVAARFFYDERGARLFEEITRLPEYYVTRTETELLRAHGNAIARWTGAGKPIVEFGAGSAVKTPILLRATNADTYVPVDISRAYLNMAERELTRTFPELEIIPIEADFTRAVHLPVFADGVTGFFPGSTIGNFDHRGALDLLRMFRSQLGDGARLVIGIDTRKDPRLLEAAYDDSAGITAAFNLNMLERINRELDGTVPIDLFEHRAIWHDRLGRIEMHLVAMRDMRFQVAGHTFSMEAGETIHTENSYKYTTGEALLLARASGWEPLAHWGDAEGKFALHVWGAMPRTMQP